MIRLVDLAVPKAEKSFVWCDASSIAIGTFLEFNRNVVKMLHG